MSEKLKEIIENMPKDILINSFETVYEDSIKKDLEIERLNNILDGYEKEMDNLINARDKAIEYIEERYNGEVLTHTFDKDNVGELLEILKGSDKE